MHRTAKSIEDALACLDRAIASWDGTDASSIQACTDLLNESIAHLKSAQMSVFPGPSEQSLGLRDAMLKVKRDAGHLACLVDSGAAFYRGLAIRISGAVPLYTASGLIIESGDERAHTGLEG